MSAKRFVELVDQAGLLDESVLAGLRQQIAEHRPTAAAVAKHLVDKGQLTKYQATQFVAQAMESAGGAAAPPDPPDVGEELTLAPIDDDPAEEARIREAAALAAEARKRQQPDQPAPETDEEVVLLEDAGDALKPVEDAGGSLTPVTDLDDISLDPVPPPMNDLLGGDEDPFDDPFAEPPSRAARSKLPRRSVWDSKLMYGGGLALALLCILFVVLFVNISKTPALEMWEAAMEDYRSGSYTQAEAKFSEFLADYPDDEKASEGRVRAALCRIRIVIADPDKGLSQSQKLLPQIESEPRFSIARDELATILIEIPQRFVTSAKSVEEISEKARLVALAKEGMELVGNPTYVPSSQRSAIQHLIKRTVEDINLVNRDIDQDNDLRQAVTEIDLAVDDSRTADAYQIYKQLLRKYPGLSADGALSSAVLRIAERQRSLVEVINDPVLTVGSDVLPVSDHRVELASLTGGPIDRVPDRAVIIHAGGMVYSLELATGQLLWSRWVGTRGGAVPLNDDADADVLLRDGLQKALLRVTARGGEVIWRSEVAEEFAEPLVLSKTALISAHSGKVLEVDVETGESARYAQLPQNLTTRGALAPTRPLIFQVADHSHVYALARPSLECEAVYYLGHREGTVLSAPLVHLGHVFVAENSGPDHCLLHALAIRNDDDQLTLEPAQQPIRLDGNVTAPLSLHGRRLLVVTDLGAVEVFDVDVNRSPSVTRAASLNATASEPTMQFPATDGRSLWIAGDRLTRFRVQVTTQEVQSREVVHPGGHIRSVTTVVRSVRRARTSASRLGRHPDLRSPCRSAACSALVGSCRFQSRRPPCRGAG